MTLSHPNIAMLFEIGQDGNRPFLVFEFVQGQPLAIADQRPRAARPPGAGVRHQPRRCARRCAWRRHDSRRHQARHHHDHAERSRKVHELRVVALYRRWRRRASTAAAPYVAPEELAGAPADSRSDIYSLGAVMFEMLTGRQRARGLVLTRLERHRASGARTNHRPDARGQRRAPRAKRGDGRRRVPQRCGHSRHPHGSSRGR